MDPITHGITGALLGKSCFSEKYGPAAVFAVTLGSVFPDVDVLMDTFSRDPLAVIRFHRGFTHSLIGLPVFSAALALLTIWWLRRRGRDGPSFWGLFWCYAVGIGSHILLDTMTSYGTRVWNPISSHRYAWDWLFIVDFLLTACVLTPQVLAWVHSRSSSHSPPHFPGHFARRAAIRAAVMWLVFAAATTGVWELARQMDDGFTWQAAAIIIMLFGLLFFAPLWRDADPKISRAKWCRAGVYVTAAYLLTCATAHHAALERVRGFADARGITAISEAAIPLPPSLLHWDGMIRTAEGAYHSRFSLADAQPAPFSYLADSPPGPVLSQALALPEVRTYLWFARFPVIRTRVESGVGIAEFIDVRFAMRHDQRVPPFTFRVLMDAQGKLLEDDWVVGATHWHLRRNIRSYSPPVKDTP
jgi:membrane-bound metal-dependent hydrolase YbcI (DUF457 family)